MNIYTYKTGAFALILAISGLPVAALAKSDDDHEDDKSVTVTTQVKGSITHSDDSDEGETRGVQTKAQATTSIRMDDSDDDFDDEELEIESEHGQTFFKLESTTTQAVSLDDLKKKIEERKHELEDEETSTTSKNRSVLKNVNPVRLTVHTLLASKDLLGGIGGQVSQIARQMNDSVATTTNAEAKIASRGFLARLLFGGDSTAAKIILEEVARNQERIDALTKLLGEANISADMQATLTVQIAALQEAQVRLQDLALKEQKQWGLLSWRI